MAKDRFFSVGTMADVLDVPVHRLQYLITKHNIAHEFVDGKTRVYGDAALEELRKLVGAEKVDFLADADVHFRHLDRGMKIAISETKVLRDENERLRADLESLMKRVAKIERVILPE